MLMGMNPFKSKQRDNPVFAYTTEPASALLFTPSLKYRDVTAERKPRYVLRTTPRKGHVQATKLERLGGHLPGVTGIYAEVRNASLEIIGVSGSESVLEMQSTAEAPDHMQVRRLLDQVKIEMKGSRIRLFNPSNRKNGHCLTQFAITCPSERPVTVRGTYSAVSLSDLTGGADIETTHGRITILNVGPVVNARVQQGILDYSGHEGSARLFAGWELNLNLMSHLFIGEVDATAEGPVRVLIPEGFSTCFEASVARDSAFVCRADIKSQIIHREETGRLIYSFGRGTPVVRLASVNGPIVIDNTVDPLEGIAANALSRPLHPTLPSSIYP